MSKQNRNKKAQSMQSAQKVQRTQPIPQPLHRSNPTTSKQASETINPQPLLDEASTPEFPSMAQEQTPIPKPIEKNESVEPLGNIQLDVLYEYICSQWNTRTVTATIRNLTTSCSAVCPPPVLWNIPQNIEIGGFVYNIMCNKKWLTDLWPTIYLMMKPNIGNLAWTSMVVCGFAYYGFLLCLPANIKRLSKPKGGEGYL